MNLQTAKWCVDVAMLIAFLLCAVTGIIKYAILLRISGLEDRILPVALMSAIHDLSGILLCLLVAVHLYLNRAWIVAMTKRILAGTPEKS